MDNITIGEIVTAIASITAIIGFVTLIYNLYKKQIVDKFKKHEDEITQLKIDVERLKKDTEVIKAESKLLLKSIKACLEGLESQVASGQSGSVSRAIEEIDKYLLEASH